MFDVCAELEGNGMPRARKCAGMLGWRGFGTQECLSPCPTSLAHACDDKGHAHAQEVDELYPSIWLYSIVSGRRIDESFQGRKALHRIPEDHVTREVTKPQLCYNNVMFVCWWVSRGSVPLVASPRFKDKGRAMSLLGFSLYIVYLSGMLRVTLWHLGFMIKFDLWP